MEKIIETLSVSGFIIVCYIILVNILSFIMFGLDKLKSKKEGASRIPESTLITVAILGGSLGALLGMKLFRHKTRHKKFTIALPIIFILELSLAIFLIIVL